MKQQTQVEKNINSELKGELVDAEKELEQLKKEFKRNETWLTTKVKRITLKSTSKQISFREIAELQISSLSPPFFVSLLLRLLNVYSFFVISVRFFFRK